MAADPPDAGFEHGSRPVPDPTLLTTQQLLREIASLRETFEIDLRGAREVLETRLDGMDKAIRLLQDTTDKFPARIDEKIDSLKQVADERFRSIDTQFKERDVRVEQTARDTKVAVDAALMAAEKAVGKQTEAFSQSIAKSEMATTKQIDQQGVLIATSTKSIDEKIDDLKDRLTRIEGKDAGTVVAHTTQQSSTGLVIAGVMMLLGIVGAIITIVGLLAPHVVK